VAIQTCPFEIIFASAQRIWGLLTRSDQLASWSGAKLIDGPTEALVPGDRVILGPGLGMRVVFEVRRLEPLRELAVDAHLPFGVVNHEVIVIAPLDGGRCRVTFN
jgi:hypothetical protein